MTAKELEEKLNERMEDMEMYDEIYVATFKRWMREIINESN